MINSTMLRPRNVLAITLISAITHFIARPVYNSVSRKDAE